MSQDWTEKYRPSSLKDIVGNPSAVKTLRGWADAWDRGTPAKKAAVLIGTPGVGKTSAALALANDMGWGVVEMNASDQRTGDAIRSVALRGAYSNTFSDSGEYLDSRDGGRKLIILDEADSLFGREDRGALPAIVELIRETRQPVVLIVNDFYALSRKSSAVKGETLQINFSRPRTSEIVKALRGIASGEGVDADDDTLRIIADNSRGDVRAAVRNLESLAMGRTGVTGEDASRLSDRVVKRNVYDLMAAIFRNNDPKEARRIMKDVDETPDHIGLWIDENLPYEYRDPGDLVRGYERLSKADVFLGRVHRRQYYRFWSYAGDLMTGGVATARMGRGRNTERIRFPSYLMKMARSKGVRSLKEGLCMKLAVMMHTSTSRISNDVLPPLKAILANDPGMRAWIVREADLEAEELAFLLNDKIDSKAVRDAMRAPVREEPPAQERGPEAPRSQKSLFEF